MTEDLVLLAVEGDRCSGPAHLPAPSRKIKFERPTGVQGAMRRMRCDSRTQTLEEKTRIGNGFLPLQWPSMCGEVADGHIYLRTDLTVAGGECFMCVAAAAKPVRAARASRAHTAGNEHWVRRRDERLDPDWQGAA